MVSFSGRISALTQGCVHRVHRTQTQQHSVTEPCAKVIRLESHLDLLARAPVSLILYQGDEAFSGLLEFAEKYHVTSAHFTAIGALSGATMSLQQIR